MPVRVAFLWHMHQPNYRDPQGGDAVLPWTRLHALKDYLGMVEAATTAAARVTFNLVPSLVDQLEAYAEGRLRDALQDVCDRPAAELTEPERRLALRGLFLANRQNLIGRFPRLEELLERRGPEVDEASLHHALQRFDTAELRDLQVLARLCWFDRGWLESDPELGRLAGRGRDFTEEDQRAVAAREAALLAAVLPAYRKAAEAGQVELCTSPYYHPILPLICDTEAHHEAAPGAPLPRRFARPEDAADQLLRARRRHQAVFGRAPDGLWPPEGSLSEAAATEIARAGFSWTASDEAVLARSAGRPLHRDSRGTVHPLEVLYRPWVRHTAAGPLTIAFRDRALSDLIGFSYSGLDPSLAAVDLLERFRRIGEHWAGAGLAGDPSVFVILDGENCWEHYRDGGREFLRTLYTGLAEDPALEAVTVSQALAGAGEPAPLPRVFAGSWIHASFDVWIGHPDDRRAWDLLGRAREALDRHGPAVPVAEREAAWEAYRVACGSDWCWWYGDDHSSADDLEFDRLFRRYLRTVYQKLKQPVPEVLNETLITARRHEVRHSAPTGAVQPTLDGEISAPGEWVLAGVFHVPVAAGAMRRGDEVVQCVRFGTDGDLFHLLIETARPAREALRAGDLAVRFPGPRTLRYRVSGDGAPVRREERSGNFWAPLPTQARACAGRVVEVAIPLAELRSGPGAIEFRVALLSGEVEIARQPETGPLRLDPAALSRA